MIIITIIMIRNNTVTNKRRSTRKQINTGNSRVLYRDNTFKAYRSKRYYLFIVSRRSRYIIVVLCTHRVVYRKLLFFVGCLLTFSPLYAPTTKDVNPACGQSAEQGN